MSSENSSSNGRDTNGIGSEAERAASTSWQLDEYRQRQRQRSELTSQDEEQAREAAAEATTTAAAMRTEAEEDEEEANVEMLTNDPVSQAHAQTHNIADDLLPSPTSSSPSAAHQFEAVARSMRAEQRRRIVFVDDVKNRTCWICSDGDQDEDSNTTAAAGKGAANRRKWVHPCKCSLVAHESCLLTWVRTRRSGANGTPNQTITCPQCSHPYTIMERKPLALILFEMGDSLLRMAVPVASAGVAGGALLVAATAYGCAAMRLFMGKEATRRTIGGKWPWHFYFDIPLIPFALILSRLRILDRAVTWLPTIVALPLVHIPLVDGGGATLGGFVGAGSLGLYLPPPRPIYYTTSRNSNQPSSSNLQKRKAWPPGPALTVLLVPWVRLLYINLKRRITRLVLSPLVRKPRRRANAEARTTQQQQQQAAGTQRGEQRRRRVIIVGQENHLLDADAHDGIADVGIDRDGLPREVPPGADAVDEHNPPPEGIELDEEGDEEEDGENAGVHDEEEELVRQGVLHRREIGQRGGRGQQQHRQQQLREAQHQTIYVSGQSLGRLCLGALAIPIVANAMGSLLKRAAMTTTLPGVGKWLAILLGISATNNYQSGEEQPQVGSRRGTLSSLFFGGGGGAGGEENEDEEGEEEEEEEWVYGRGYAYPWRAPVDRYANLDPVWWRNAVGAGLFIVAKDVAQLVFRYMRLNHAKQGSKRTKILDRPFEGNMVDELELR